MRVLKTRIGILDVQGAISEHVHHVDSVDCAVASRIKCADDLESVDGLIIPGGESTSISKLMKKFGLYEPVRDKILAGMPVLGTCAGLILLANRIEGQEEAHLGIMDIVVNRNSFGRQRESFEADLMIDGLGEVPFPSVFIRAPHIVEVGPGVQILASYGERVVAARQGSCLVTAFHPELTADLRIHEWFVRIVQKEIS